VTTPALHLSKIDLTSFRGVHDTLALEFGRRLTIIYGGNATGKSSIAQAIEFALSGQVRDYEDGLIPPGYLANTRSAANGQVSLTLNDGAVLAVTTDQGRSDIERRFRDVGSVDWPERQTLPLTTTHVTTQGMLARILGTTNVVTRNDLSGLCAGAYLRFLVARAQRLADHFRQGSSGRNIQSELSDARAQYDTAKLLRNSLVTTAPATDISPSSVDLKVRELNTKLGLPGPDSLDGALSHLERRLEDNENQLRILQSLLSRTRELGQHEAESNELRSQLKAAQTAQDELAGKRDIAKATLLKAAQGLAELTRQRAHLLDELAAYEQYQQAVSAIAGLEERLRELRSNEQQTKENIQGFRQQLDSARSDLVARSAKLAQLRQSRQTAELQRNAIQQALSAMSALPAEGDSELEATLATLRQELITLERSAEAASRELDELHRRETSIGSQLGEVSKLGERLLAATAEMRQFVIDGRCPLCGHDHGSIPALEQSIKHVTEAALVGADSLRRDFDTASSRRQQSEKQQLELQRSIEDNRSRTSNILATLQKRSEQRRAAISTIDQNLRRAGVSTPLDTAALRRAQAEIEAKIPGVDQEIRDESEAEHDDENRRSQFERSLAAKTSEGAQLERLAAELNNQIAKLRATLSSGASPEEIESKRTQLAEIEPQLKTLEREHGQAQATQLELDRTITEKATEIAGVQRRLQVVDAFLDSLDNALKSVGASRDVRTVLAIEQRARQDREDLTLFKNKGLEIKQNLRALEQTRAVSNAQEQLAIAEQGLKSVQDRQRRLQERSVQFKNLFQGLQTVQDDTAEIVLANIRKPVSILFQAMTAGCPWDIEFRLQEGKVNAVLTDGLARDVTATSVLNSAYVNVAAIALRLALASQQRWTRLRTVVLDDPILEMDNLTQFALIDGLEAVLSSTFAPWRDLQFVLTTWSEDFAVMAAHKLAHLNHGENLPRRPVITGEDFIIHRLSSDLDGTIVSQLHVPRWRSEATAA
jgi:DNA repair protein SbcC/Rad50